MALSRRSGARFQANIWPGFVDAMTGLLLVLMFVLTIFMIVQFVLREEISGQATKLDALSAEVGALARTLGLEQARSARLDEQIAGLLTEREQAQRRIAALEGERSDLLGEQEQLQSSIAGLRSEIDAQLEAARLAAARREALEALTEDLRREAAEGKAAQAALGEQVANLQAELGEEEKARLAEAAAAEALRRRLEGSEAELTSMTLALEEERKRAEETLTLLAAAEAAKQEADQLAQTQMSEAEARARLLAEARARLSSQEEMASEAQKQQALLNSQVAALRSQLAGLQALLDEAKARDQASSVQLQSLGQELNTALARVAAEERRRRQAEEERAHLLEAERARLSAEKEDLEKYRSEFFGRMRDLLGQQEGVRVVGDRFVFSSEVLFAPGEASLSPAGEGEIAKVAAIIQSLIGSIPEGIDWVLQVDGHTDNVPIIEGAKFADNWELSQARAVSVVRYLTNVLGFPADRLSANGFGEYQPVNPANTPEARAQNRRIELKLTGK